MPKLKEQEIIERWSVLISGGEVHTKGKQVFRKTTENIQGVKTPKVDLFEQEVIPSFVRRLRGEGRTFLMAENKYLKGYKMYIGAMPYGEQLFVSWYLTLEPSWLRRLLAHLPNIVMLILMPVLFPLYLYLIIKRKRVHPENMDIFDLQELSAYITTVHHALIDATEDICKDVDFDFTKVDTKTQGFLNIS